MEAASVRPALLDASPSGPTDAGALVLVIRAAFGVDLQKAYYIVILSTLVQHYYLDHLQFTKLGDMLGTGDRLLAGRSAAS